MKIRFMKVKNLLSIWMLFVLISIGTVVQASEDISSVIETNHAYVNAVPPVMKVTAAYMHISNHSHQMLRLIGASSPIAGKVTLHNSGKKNGMMRMMAMDAIEIASHDTVMFSPGGLHLMLEKLKKPLKAGAHVDITLLFADDKHVTVHAPVRDLREESDGHGGHHHHH